ncbi:hypothetical protein B0J12DRAFT_762355, partial [Macrophomina phaseolina]
PVSSQADSSRGTSPRPPAARPAPSRRGFLFLFGMDSREFARGAQSCRGLAQSCCSQVPAVAAGSSFSLGPSGVLRNANVSLAQPRTQDLDWARGGGSVSRRVIRHRGIVNPLPDLPRPPVTRCGRPAAPLEPPPFPIRHLPRARVSGCSARFDRLSTERFANLGSRLHRNTAAPVALLQRSPGMLFGGDPPVLSLLQSFSLTSCSTRLSAFGLPPQCPPNVFHGPVLARLPSQHCSAAVSFSSPAGFASHHASRSAQARVVFPSVQVPPQRPLA